MQELRFVAVSEDGSYAVLAIPGRSGRFMLPIDDRLRAVARGQFSRLAQYEIEVENPLRPKEIQARIRAGETVEEIADAAGIPVERVRWFEGPVLAERGYVAAQAQTASVRRQGDSTPGPRLGEVVAERLTELGADPEDAQWDSRKHGDGSWQVQLAFRAGGRLHIAEWLFDPRRRHVSPADDNAGRLSLPEADLPAPTGGSLGAATVTPIRPRPDRREAAPQHQAVAEPVEEPARAAAHAASPSSFAPPRPPVVRPPSHAAPHPNAGSRLPATDDQRNGPAAAFTDRPGASGRGGAGQGVTGQGPDRRPAEEPTRGPAQNAAAQSRTAPGGTVPGGTVPGGTVRRPDAQSPAVGRPAGQGAAAQDRAGQPAAPALAADRTATRDQDRPSAGPDVAASRIEAPSTPDIEAWADVPEVPDAAASRAEAPQVSDIEASGGDVPQAPGATETPASVTRDPGNGRPQAPAPAQAAADKRADEAAADKRADEAAARGLGKKAAGPRGRRSSVPSWDEIMLGNSRQPD